MTFINSGYGASNYSNSVNNTSLPNNSIETFDKKMQGSGQNTAKDMNISNLLAMIEQFLKALKGGGSESGSQADNGQGAGSSGSNGSDCACSSNAGKKTGSSNGNEGSAGGAGSLGDKEGNGGGTISNTDKSRRGDEMSKGTDKSSRKH